MFFLSYNAGGPCKIMISREWYSSNSSVLKPFFLRIEIFSLYKIFILVSFFIRLSYFFTGFIIFVLLPERDIVGSRGYVCERTDQALEMFKLVSF